MGRLSRPVIYYQLGYQDLRHVRVMKTYIAVFYQFGCQFPDIFGITENQRFLGAVGVLVTSQPSLSIHADEPVCLHCINKSLAAREVNCFRALLVDCSYICEEVNKYVLLEILTELFFFSASFIILSTPTAHELEKCNGG